MNPGRAGTEMATEMDLLVPMGSIRQWTAAGNDPNRRTGKSDLRFGHPSLSIRDPDGLRLALVETSLDPNPPGRFRHSPLFLIEDN